MTPLLLLAYSAVVLLVWLAFLAGTLTILWVAFVKSLDL